MAPTNGPTSQDRAATTMPCCQLAVRRVCSFHSAASPNSMAMQAPITNPLSSAGSPQRLWGEPDAATGLGIGACIAMLLGLAAEWKLHTRRTANWQHGMVVAALSWLVGPFVGAIPLFLSGHYDSFLDSYFDAMSGFATAGLSVMADLDHVADCVNLWRHMTHFLGGQGLVLLVLS